MFLRSTVLVFPLRNSPVMCGCFPRRTVEVTSACGYCAAYSVRLELTNARMCLLDPLWSQ